MKFTITLDERHSKKALEAARALGMTPQQYIDSLIEAASQSFDEILAPVRNDFSQSGMTEADLDKLVLQARKAVRSSVSRKKPE